MQPSITRLLQSGAQFKTFFGLFTRLSNSSGQHHSFEPDLFSNSRNSSVYSRAIVLKILVLILLLKVQGSTLIQDK